MSVTNLALAGGAVASIPDQDILSDQGGLLRSRGDTLWQCTFEGGSFEGWPDHWGYATPNSHIGLTNKVESGTHALMLSTPETSSAVATTFGAATYKRDAVDKDWDVVSFSGKFALWGEGDITDRKYPFGSVMLGIDTQWPDDSHRTFAKLMLKDIGDGAPAWYVGGGKTSSASGAASKADVLIPGSQKAWVGMNERKWNYQYWRLTYSRKANGGMGGYVEAQVGGKVFDLRALTGTPYDLLLNNGSADMFTGGFNCGIGLGRSTLNPGYKYNALLIDNVKCTVNDVLAGV